MAFIVHVVNGVTTSFRSGDVPSRNKHCDARNRSTQQTTVGKPTDRTDGE